MKKVTIRQLLPIIMALFGSIFAIVGFFQLGFWNKVDGPMPGFFPSIMAIVMVVTSILALFQSWKEDKKTEYKKEEILVIAAGVGIFAVTFLIGLLPTIFLYVVLWLKLFEKESWKNTLIVLGVAAAISIGVFYIWLGVQFPLGLFEYIM